MNIIKNNQGISALVAIIIISVSALVMTRLAASSATTNLDSEILLSGQSMEQTVLWNCAMDALKIWDLSGSIPNSASNLDDTCAVTNQSDGLDYIITIEKDNKELILEISNASNIDIINHYYK